MFRLRTAILCLLVAITLSYTVTTTCGPCSGPGTLCVKIDGGPFSNTELSIDLYPQLFNLCQLGTVGPFVADFQCDFTCVLGCGFSATIFGQPAVNETCTKSPDGAIFVGYLDLAYGSYKGKATTYDWCANLDCSSASTIATGLLIALIVGGVVLLGIIGAIVTCVVRRMRAKARNALEGAYRAV